MKYFSGLLFVFWTFSLAAQTVNYTYDQAGHLAAVVYPNGTTTTYAYDASGNLLRKVIAATGTGPAPAPTKNGVVNVASEQGTTVAPGEMVVIYGTGIGPATLSLFQITAASFFDTIAGNTTVSFDGILAPLYYASAGQTVAIVPYSVAGQTSTQMVVTYNGVASAPTTLNVASSAPGLFSANTSGTGNGAIVNADGTVNSPANPAARGSYVSLYGTGEGQTNPSGVNGRIALSVYPKPVSPVKVTIGGVDATSGILYMGAAPTLVAGVFQLVVTVPASVAAGAVPVVVTVGSVSSQAGLTVSLK
jgi:trimeric autotransporter adhesin